MNEFETKKKALAAESEVYRQTLKLEIQNLRMCAIREQPKIDLLGASSSLWTLGAPIAGIFLGRGRRGPLISFLQAAFTGWRWYRKVGPLIAACFPTQARRLQPDAENRAPSANI